MNLILHGNAVPEALARQLAQATQSASPVAHGTHAVLLANAHRNEATQLAVDAACAAAMVDYAWQEQALRWSDFGLLVFDMDSTLVNVETIDEIADYCGRKAEVAAITEAAMQGEITDYGESLRQRVALLKGLNIDVLQQVYDERMRLSPGAERLVSTAQAHGLKTLIVSGGFTFFTERLKERLRMDFARSNILKFDINAGVATLAGTVSGEIVDADVKAREVRETCARLGLETKQAIVMGDGANDLKMMALAGWSVAYRAKPVVRAQASCAFNHCGLDGLLNILGD
jgi:phosphoserine phosphatase